MAEVIKVFGNISSWFSSRAFQALTFPLYTQPSQQTPHIKQLYIIDTMVPPVPPAFQLRIHCENAIAM